MAVKLSRGHIVNAFTFYSLLPVWSVFVKNCGSGFKCYRNIQTRDLDMEGLPPPSAIKRNDRWMRPCIMNITGTFATDVIATLFPFMFHQNSELFPPCLSSPFTCYEALWSPSGDTILQRLCTDKMCI